ncbi:hypothetical protein AZ78_1257 [Lysobacter capsici AZ78]|uniref:Uncharacterized protein n=1 Tax=Lysobacter capsici AZ78 TaxID=1444315 RepID=A0A125MMK6_9GAMM|nr:hypothetical protein AZ78_1257 [Lysobacter capsici AZ78]
MACGAQVSLLPRAGEGGPKGRMRARAVAGNDAICDSLTPTPARPKRMAFGRARACEPVARKQRPLPRQRERGLRSN